MKRLPPLLCTLLLLWAAITPAWSQISAEFSTGGDETTLDCKTNATVNVTYTGNYVASAQGGALIIDPDTGEEVPILVTSASSFQVKMSFGSGKIYVADPANTAVIDSVQVNATNLNSLVGSITGSACLTSDGSGNYTVPVDSRAGDVEYSWAIIRGQEHTQIDPATRNSATVSVNSLNAGTSLLRVVVTNDCSGEFCSSPTRYFWIRKEISAEDRAEIDIVGTECVSDDVLGEDNLIVLSVQPVLGRWDPTEYVWNYDINKLQREFVSSDGSAIAFKVLDNTEDIEVTLDLGPTCNSGLTYTQILKAPAPTPILGAASTSFTESATFCLPENDGSGTLEQETFRVLNNPDTDFQYHWIIPDSWTLVSATGPDSTEVVIQLNNNSAGTITVVGTNDGCGDSFSSININRFPSTAPLIAGPECISLGDTEVVQYTVLGGDNTYDWTVETVDSNGTKSPASWTPVNPDNVNSGTIQFTPDFTGVANGAHFLISAEISGNCGTGESVISELEVAIGPPTPTYVSITPTGGSTTVVDSDAPQCFTSGLTYELAASDVLFASGYTWSFPASANGWQFSPSNVGRVINVVAGTGPITISVIATGCSNSEAFTFNATLNPATPTTPVITQTDCITPTTSGTVTVEVTDDANVTSYDWNTDGLTGITEIGGNGRNTMQIQIAAGANINQPIHVTAYNAAGCSVTSANLTLEYGDAPEVCASSVAFGDFFIGIEFTSLTTTNYTYEWYDVATSGTETLVVDANGNPNTARSYLWYNGVGRDKPNKVHVIVIDPVTGCRQEYVLPDDNADNALLCSSSTSTASARMASDGSLMEPSYGENYIIAPNPASDFITVNTNSTDLIYSVHLLGQDGKVAVHQTVGATSYKLSTAAVAPGLYYLIVQGAKGNHFRKVIIKH